MKNFALSLILLSVICALTVANAIGVKYAMDKIMDDVEALDFEADENTPDEVWEEYEGKVKELRRKWDRTVRYVSLSVNHNDIMEANSELASLEGAAKVKDYVEYGVSVSTLTNALDHLRKLAGVGLDTLL